LTVLLDGNVLVALSVADHVHHRTVVEWFAANERGFVTTPTTQGTLLRFLLRAGLDAADAAAVLEGLRAHVRHSFWPDDAPYEAFMLRGVVGHRQVTGAYLAARARERGAQVATLDRGLAAARADVAELIEAPA
jgi:uncharacterized protein